MPAPVGGFTLKGQLLEFEPKKQTLGAGLLATQKWEKVELSFKIGVIAAGEHVKEVNGQAVVKSNDFSITVDGAAKPEEKKPGEPAKILTRLEKLRLEQQAKAAGK